MHINLMTVYAVPSLKADVAIVVVVVQRCCCSITVTAAAAASQGVPLRCIVLSPMKYGGNFNKRHLSLARGSV